MHVCKSYVTGLSDGDTVCVQDEFKAFIIITTETMPVNLKTFTICSLDRWDMPYPTTHPMEVSLKTCRMVLTEKAIKSMQQGLKFMSF